MASVLLRDVSKSFGHVEVLRDVNVTMEEGEFVVLVGPSGCGKTTLLRIIAGLEDPTDGVIQIGGRVVNDVDASKRGAAMVFQSYALYPHKSVTENMGFALKMSGHSKKDIAERVHRTGKTLQLEHLLDRKPRELSGGQRQRVAIGRAIVRNPDVFLFDEPLSNLDAALRIDMRLELARLHRELGATMIYVTHDQVEAMTLASKIVVMRDGKIEQVGSPRELYEKPANKFVAGFLGMPKMNFIRTRGARNSNGASVLECHGIAKASISVPVAPESVIQGEVEIGIRPEKLRLGKSGAHETSIRAKAAHAEYLGASLMVYLDIETQWGLQRVVASASPDAAVTLDEEMDVSFSPEDCRVFDGSGMILPVTS